ncbi:MAG: hypothetical protein ABIO32_16175 [Ferruginibacter sp.]
MLLLFTVFSIKMLHGAFMVGSRVAYGRNNAKPGKSKLKKQSPKRAMLITDDDQMKKHTSAKQVITNKRHDPQTES